MEIPAYMIFQLRNKFIQRCVNITPQRLARIVLPLKETNDLTMKSKKHPTHKFRVSTIEPKLDQGNFQCSFKICNISPPAMFMQSEHGYTVQHQDIDNLCELIC